VKIIFTFLTNVPGDLYDEEKILEWLMDQKDPGGDVIEHYAGDELQKLIYDSDSLAVYFCEYLTSKSKPDKLLIKSNNYLSSLVCFFFLLNVLTSKSKIK